MKNLNEYIKEQRTDEGLFDIFPHVHIPSMEEIMMWVISALAAWELLKLGGKITLDFFKTLFTGKTKYSKSIGEVLAESTRNKLSKAIRGVSPKDFTKQLIQLKKDVSSGKLEQTEIKERLMNIIKENSKLSDDDINDICKELEQFTKDEQRAKKLADALNIKLD